MDTFVFFTKNRSPIRVQAMSTTEACERFYAEHPDFHLRELMAIKVASVKSKKHWLEDNSIVKQ